MTFARGVYSALLWLYPRAFRTEMGDDLEQAFARALEEAASAGRNPARVALRELGDLTRNLPGAWWEWWTTTRTRTTGVTTMTDGLAQDLRYAFRSIRTRPGFATVMVLTLALGIGANAAAFGVVDGVLLDPLDYPDSEELVYMIESSREGGTKSVSYLNYLDWRERNRVFEDVGARTGWSLTLTGHGDAREVAVRLVSANLPAVLGVEPLEGRMFTAEEEARGERVVVLGGEMWASRFGSDPDVVGRTLTLDAEPWTVVGVLPPALEFPLDGVEVFAPLTTLSEGDRANRSSHPGISVIGRLRDGTDLDAATADMDAVARALAEEYPDTNAGAGVVVRSLRDRYVGSARGTLLVLSGAVVLVLLLACANVANLLLVRGQGRSREAAVRAALGAGRGRVARTYVVESLVLAVLGGIAGLVLAWAGVEIFRALAADLPRAHRVRMDGGVLGVAAGLSLLAAVAVGVAPALRLSATDPADRLRAAGAGSGGGRREGRFRSGLVVTEVAVSFVLLVGATLMLRSMGNLLHEDPGLDTRGVLTARVNLPTARYPTVGDRARFYDRVLEDLRALPGVVSAGAGDPLPLSGYDRQWSLSGEGLENVGPEGLRADQSIVTPGYFEALGIPLLAGRTFTARDGAPDSPAVIDETMAERLWPGENPLGRHVTFSGDDSPTVLVVGVVGHVKHYGVDEAGRVQIYLPHHLGAWNLNLVVRTHGDPLGLLPGVRSVVSEIDPSVPLDRIHTMEDLFAGTVAAETLAARVLTAFGVVALLLAVLGLYGLVSYAVRRRSREIGIRLALGARKGALTARMTSHGIALATMGVVLGLVGVVPATRYLSDLLFGVRPHDPETLAAVAALLLAVAALAAFVPAVRAARMDPSRTLREE